MRALLFLILQEVKKMGVVVVLLGFLLPISDWSKNNEDHRIGHREAVFTG